MNLQPLDVVLEEVLGLDPDARRLPILELQQGGKEVVAKGLGGLAGEEGGEMVDGDDGKGWWGAERVSINSF